MVTNLTPERMFRLGLARTFQKNSLFLDLTTQENVRLAVQAHQRKGHHWFQPWWAFDALNERTRRVLERAGLVESSTGTGEEPVLWRAAATGDGDRSGG